MSTKARAALMVTLLIGITTSTACSSHPANPEPGLGTFNLSAVDGASLPAILFEGWVEMEEDSPPELLRIEVVSGALSLRRGGRYEKEILVRAFVQGQFVSNSRWRDQGRMTPSGQGIRFESTHIQNVAFDGSVEGNRVQVREDLLRHFHDTGALSHFRFER